MVGRESNIVIVKLSSLGDIVHALQAVSILERVGGFKVKWLVKRTYLPLFEGIDFIEPVVPDFSNLISLRRGFKFRFGLDLQGLIKSAILLYFVSPDLRIGFSFNEVREKLAVLLYNVRVDTSDRRHVVEKLRKLITEALGIADDGVYDPLIRIRKEELEKTFSFVPDKNFILITPSSSWESKRLKLSWVTELVRRIEENKRVNKKVYILPGIEDSERYINSELRDRTIPSLTLRESIALVSRASAIISPDTGFLHIASAFGVPVVGIYGPSDPVRNGPFNTRYRLVFTSCTNIGCGKRNCSACSSMVPVDRVVSSLADLLLNP